MAQTEHLPIYERAYDLCLYLEQVVRKFPRYHKYSLGQDLRDGARRVLRPVVRANAHADKAPVLLQIREEVEELKILLRLCHDAKALPSFRSFEHAITQLTDIAKLDGAGVGKAGDDGQDLHFAELKMESPEECAQACEDEARCKAMTFLPDIKRCFLKHSVPAAEQKFGNVSAIKTFELRLLPPKLQPRWVR